MAKTLLVVLVTFSLVCVSFIDVQAGGFGIDEQGAAAMGRANAFVAQADDPSALFYNPAGISQLKGTQLSLGTTVIIPSTTFDSDVTGDSTDIESTLFFPPTFYISHQLSETLHIGLGAFSPFGLSTEWPENWEGRYLTTFFGINTLYINPNIVWSPRSRVHLAAGISYVPSNVTLKNKLDLSALALPDGNAKIKADGDGWGYNLALLVLLPRQNRLGISFRSPVSIEYDGDAQFSPSAVFEPAQDQDASSSLILPPILVIGLANQALDGYTFEADVQWTGWASIDNIKINFEDPSFNSETPKEWRNSFTFRVGVERIVERLLLRGGYAYDMTPIPSETIDPSLPDADKHKLSVGGGYTRGKIKVDFAYMIVLLKDREADNVLTTGGTPFVHQGEYSTVLHEVGISLTYAF